ncbi:hypothetical protein GBA52_015209 [Prunus armeniaca]|nr:hypothetical protein GBA52_015209 [Prunus armeniaca]
MLNDPEVWRTVSVEKYQWHPEWYEFYQEKLVEFLQKCKEHNNPEIIYREAITQFFIFKDDEVINNFRVAAKAGDMESSYIVGLLGLVNHTEGEEDAMELLCHLSKTKKIDMQACRESIMNRLMRYTISGLVTPPTLAKFTADIIFFLNCVNCKAMSISSINTEAKRCRHCNAEMKGATGEVRRHGQEEERRVFRNKHDLTLGLRGTAAYPFLPFLKKEESKEQPRRGENDITIGENLGEP